MGLGERRCHGRMTLVREANTCRPARKGCEVFWAIQNRMRH